MEASTEIPTSKRAALDALKVGSSKFLDEVVTAIYGWSVPKMAPEYAAIYGGSVMDAADLGEDRLRHALAVYVSALYHGLPVDKPHDLAALGSAYGGFVAQAIQIRETKTKMVLADERKRNEARARKERAKVKRDRDRKNRKQARRG